MAEKELGDLLADLLQKLAISAPVEAAEIETIREGLNSLSRFVDRQQDINLQAEVDARPVEAKIWS
jgi:hypothetical protein